MRGCSDASSINQDGYVSLVMVIVLCLVRGTEPMACANEEDLT